MNTFKKVCGYIFAGCAGLAAGAVVSFAAAFVALMILLDPGTTDAELEAARGRCEQFLRDLRDTQEHGR